jgi:tetratricopeptide (TPR) repeat protein
VSGCAQKPVKSEAEIRRELGQSIEDVERASREARIRLDGGDYEKALQIAEELRESLPEPQDIKVKPTVEQWIALGNAAHAAYRLPVEISLKQGHFNQAIQALDDPGIARLRVLEDEYLSRQMQLVIGWCPDSGVEQAMQDYLSEPRKQLRHKYIFRLQRAFDAGKIYRESGRLRSALERFDALRAEIMQIPDQRSRQRLLAILDGAYARLDLTPVASRPAPAT